MLLSGSEDYLPRAKEANKSLDHEHEHVNVHTTYPLLGVPQQRILACGRGVREWLIIVAVLTLSLALVSGLAPTRVAEVS